MGFSVGLDFRLLAALVVSLSISAADGFFIDERHSPATIEWNYQEQHRWWLKSRECRGKAQSPIDIQRHLVIPNDQLSLLFFDYDRPIKFNLSNGHHTIRMGPIQPSVRRSNFLNTNNHRQQQPDAKLQTSERVAVNSSQLLDMLTSVGDPDSPEGDMLDGSVMSGAEAAREVDINTPNSRLRVPGNGNPNSNIPGQRQQQAHRTPAQEGMPSIKLDWFDEGNNEFILHDIHFHWAERRDNGSEHAIDGARAAMEMHLVHLKKGITKDQISFLSDSVVVIGILIESHRKSNADFNPIVNELPKVNMSEQTVEIGFKSLNELLPTKMDSFYTYSGSLTTPPCYQTVNWIVMTERLNMNAKQIEMFRTLYAPPGALGTDFDHIQAMMPNVRHLQPVNNRTIMLAVPNRYTNRHSGASTPGTSTTRGDATTKSAGNSRVPVLSSASLFSLATTLLISMQVQLMMTKANLVIKVEF